MFGTVPPIAEIIVLLVDGSRGRTIKSCFGHRVFRLRTPVSSCEAPGMLDKGSALKSPSKEMWASPANSSIMANNKRYLSLTCQNLLLLSIDESYHQHPFRFSRQASLSQGPSMRRPVDVKAHFFFLLSSFFPSVPIQPSRPCRHPSIRTLCERYSLGARWVFSFSRCCYLIIDLSPTSVGVGPQDPVAVTWTRRSSSAVPIKTL